MDSVAQLATRHLALRLKPLHRALRAAATRRAAAADALAEPDLARLCITPEHAGALIDAVDGLCDAAIEETASDPRAALTEAEARAEEDLRARAGRLGAELPLDRIARELRLDAFEVEALLLCAAPEIESTYEHIFAFVLDDLNRKSPCVELLCGLTASTLAERLARRAQLAPWGRLRRVGLLRATGEAATEARQELRLAPGALQFVLGTGDLARFADPDEVPLAPPRELPPHVNAAHVEKIARGLSAGLLQVAAVWGARETGVDDVVQAIACSANLPLRRLRVSTEADRAALKESVSVASALGALLWVPVDALSEPGADALRGPVEEALTAATARVVLAGAHPWRPTSLIAARPYVELSLEPPTLAQRAALWARETGGLPEARAVDFAGRLRLEPREIRAVASAARAAASLETNGHAAPFDHLDQACTQVTRKRSERFARMVVPRRAAEDLVLAADLHRRILDIAGFFRAWPRVSEAWGFGRLATGAGGIKALFSGEPGTGKTLAAEVIAGLLRLPLCKVDLAQVVSKWVGETEKNLDAAFREAEESQAVLFFDEAEALFGKRGEVRHGTDRYANLEVSFLLQRLEDHAGLVILASNLRDQIDAAFTRRFHVTVHFPRPERAERLRIWRLAMPSQAPLDAAVDLEALAGLDLTGAGIVASARTAALLAAQEESARIETRHVVQAIARQFRQEARVLNPGDLGPYAAHCKEA
jgi:hypothetical protein